MSDRSRPVTPFPPRRGMPLPPPASAAESSSPIGGEVVSADDTARRSWLERGADRVAKFLTDTRTIALFAVGLVALGAWGAVRVQSLATKADLASARKATDEAIAEHAKVVHPGTLARLDDDAKAAAGLEKRVLVLETNQVWIVDALKSIANRVGAATPPAPTSSTWVPTTGP